MPWPFVYWPYVYTMQLEDNDKKTKKKKEEKKKAKKAKKARKKKEAADKEAYRNYPWHLYGYPYSTAAAPQTYYQPVSEWFCVFGWCSSSLQVLD